jgi:Domain of unknown function (DUF5348)
MNETSETIINCVDGEYTLRNNKGKNVLTLSVGMSFELKLRGEWCRVHLESGGYKGRYYVTAAGERGRLALGMEARTCEQVQIVETAVVPLDQARAAWVGKDVESRVPLAGGLVRGVVREITQWGQVVFVYSPRLNGVPVVVSFPVERVGEVLALASVAA